MYMKVLSTFFFLVCLTLISSYGFAVQGASEVDPEVESVESMIVDIEVIEITGNRSLNSFRRALSRAEKSLYEEYNKLTQNNEFKISCKKEQIALDSKKKRQICKPRYENILVAKETQFAASRAPEEVGDLTHIVDIASSQQFAYGSRLESKRREHFEDMLELLKQNPELKQKLIDYVVAMQKYQLRKEQRFND